MRILQDVVEFRRIRCLTGAFSYAGFEGCKNQLVDELTQIVKHSEVDLSYQKARDRTAQVKIERLAALYFAIRKSLKANEQRDASIDTTPFSIKTVKDAIKETLGPIISHNEAVKLRETLESLDIIWKLGGYTPGQHGQRFGVRRHLGGLLLRRKARN